MSETHQPAHPRFSLGRTVATANAMEVLARRDQEGLISTVLARHVLGDWGDVPPEDAETNEQALKQGGRLMSVYKVDDSLTLWVITERDRSYTTILLPEDY